MDTQDSSIDAPHMKLAKVGKGRERKRGGAGWLSGARGTGSGFGALGGAGAGGAGMSLGKILMVLLVSAGVSAGAWQLGGRLAGNSSSSSDDKSAAPKAFASREPQKYADTSGVIKAENSIPNSLGFINNDGLTAEQRADKKAADDAAAASAAKAAADAQAKADADAKAKALADAKAAATADASAGGGAGAKEVPGKGSLGSKFGKLGSGFGSGGGLSGGAGMSGGIARNFGGGVDGSGGRGQKGSLGAMSNSATKVATTRSATPTARKSNAKGFLAPLQTVANMTGTASKAGTAEGASSQAGTPFDNNAGRGTSIAGPGIGSGLQTGPSDGGGGLNPGNGGGPIGGGGNCATGQQIDGNGNCQNISSPTGMNAAPYQGLLNTVMLLLGIIAVLSMIAVALQKTIWGTAWAMALILAIAAMGAVVAAMGIAIAAMPHGDFMIGAIVGVIGAYVAYSSIASMGMATSSAALEIGAAHVMIASAVGAMAATSAKSKSMMGG